MSFDRWMDKETDTHMYTHTCTGILVIKKKGILLFATTCINLKGIILSEISQTEKDKYYMVSLICRI